MRLGSRGGPEDLSAALRQVGEGRCADFDGRNGAVLEPNAEFENGRRLLLKGHYLPDHQFGSHARFLMHWIVRDRKVDSTDLP